MAFDNLMEKLQGTFKKLRGKGKVSEADVKGGYAGGSFGCCWKRTSILK